MKRFRSRVKVPIRYYMRGEYDEQNDRPQEFALIFGDDFSDKVLHNPGDSSDTHLYSSPLLSSLWKFGPASFGGSLSRYDFMPLKPNERFKNLNQKGT